MIERTIGPLEAAAVATSKAGPSTLGGQVNLPFA